MAFSQFNYYQKLNRFNSNQAGKREREEDNNGEKGGILTYFRRKRTNANVGRLDGEKEGILTYFRRKRTNANVEMLDGEKEGILTYFRRKRTNTNVEMSNGEKGGMLTYERRRKRESNRDGGGERGGGGGISFKEGGALIPVNKERKLSRLSSPQTSFLMPHSTSNRYYLISDMWTEVVKHLGVKEMIILSSTSRWLNSLFSQGYIWKCAFLRDMNIPVSCPESFPWKEIYYSAFDGSHAFNLRHQDGHMHIEWIRLGAFYLSSQFVILRQTLSEPSMVPPVGVCLDISVKIIGMCCLDNARTGIWISGDVHVLDVRHFELFMEEGYKNGTWQYEDIAITIIPYPSAVATSGIFDLTHIRSPNTYRMIT
ncbi:hypothetical protein LUZ61_004849 [Rhynchospora tenuis]|uniref:F-box domain-containing protein n=1 Tax=Rhynchospora tenuis TaxID=198213 RepID=A0AAD5ZNU7_9POAL|nr:hypothetical protein LUZ61_004849 [Rhynchospora tenuis]